MRDHSITDTRSVCPECLKRIPARRIAEEDRVYMVKQCPEHGEYRALLWRGNPSWESWMRPTIPSQPLACFTEVEKGCPYDCGLCADHWKQTCTALMEVTRRCNLNCRYCFADAGDSVQDPSLEVLAGWYRKVMEASGPTNIQLSGGEPTLRDDLPEIVALGKAEGFGFIQINTNGLRLAQDMDYVRRLQEGGLNSVFLQFDGVDDSIYRALRGREMLKDKMKAIENCSRFGIGVVLVPTLVPGINPQQIGDMVRFALDHHPGVRGVHFQPVSYFGRIPQVPGDEDRFTLPEVIQAIEEQTQGLIQGIDLKPNNGRCSFSGSFVKQSDGTLRSVQTTNCCGEPEPAEDLVRKTRAFVARQWGGTGETDCACRDENSWDFQLKRIKEAGFAVTGMAFQDAWNLDLERLQNCCIHVLSPEERMIPFCAYNLTNRQGKSLYRKGS
ncbi:putative Fe-S oxidoreductase [Desulfitobacterium dehalogenans ATCC 51507]|uniref:Putative Fe-S oxidoreductase n=1 Tax=Desulfitobacterium dehalogenans (strain ATCC 51507 / DSM 9161 / JW/IU-DC1) TaxID=756499 RepID=I4AAE3_DESDJ|nr:radical SAM (seleno)protein TrsS [Desulfitobacterium dehalogenans]AFM00928.1 putative Fe-S oxidoreductase [Desulfitobacterium dehalogenans ATCC 51507]